MLANEVLRKQYVFPGHKDQTAKSVQEYLGVGLKATQTQVMLSMSLYAIVFGIYHEIGGLSSK